MVRVHGIGEAAAFAHFLEQAGAHAAAEDAHQHGHRLPAVVDRGDGRPADEDVGLFGVAAQLPHRPLLGRHAVRGGGAHRGGQGPVGQRPAAGGDGGEDELAHLHVVDVADRGDQQALGGVVLAVVVADVFQADGHDGLGGAADGAAQGRVRSEDISHHGFEADVSGIVLRHGELFEDHFALGEEGVLVQQRGGDHISEDADGHGEIGGAHASVVAGVLLRGGGIGLPADLIERGGDLQGGAARRSLEQEVFEDVGGAGVLGGLVAGADGQPEADGGGADRRVAFGDEADAAGKDGAADQGTGGVLEGLLQPGLGQ